MHESPDPLTPEEAQAEAARILAEAGVTTADPLPPADQLHTADQLAQRWGCSRPHIYNLMKRGMPSLKLGTCRRFRPLECEAWAAEQEAAA